MNGEHQEGAHCDTCGEWCAWSEFVETIEEYLCERCASGIDEDELDNEGFKEGFED